MRNLKRFLAMALTVLMVVGSFSAMSVSAFEDVTDYQEAIDVMAALGILKGTDEEADLFSPEENIARWQMALIITKMMTGKVDAAYVEANFNTSINSTLYTDLNEGQYMGATAYAANNGIVVGTSATTYEPEAEIMIQDVFTMVVRMLGYGSTAMNANYPWSFIDKAISLGLDAGLPADYANEKAATRGETAQILYNALTAVKADGSTLGYDFFGLEKATVIITGTKAGNMFNSKAAVVTKTVDGVDQVAFAVLNADGTLGATTYYAPKTAFGIDKEANANAYVGYPFVVRTNDAFASFLTVDPIEAVALDQDAVVGATADAGKGKITLDGQEYVLAETYSDFIKDNSVEIILNQVGTYANTFDYGSYVMDEALNIMGKDGKVLLKWIQIGNPGGNSFQNGTYLYEVAEGKFIVPNDAIWAQAATYTTGTEAYGFKAIMDSKALEAKDAYSDTVVFDIDGDGDYDRGIYTNYSLTKIADGKNIDTATTTSALTFVTADGEAAKFADYNGKYVLYAYNDLYNTVIIKTAFETNTALVTGADLAANKITFNGFGLDFLGAVVGETYAYGNAKLPGAVVITDKTGSYFAEIIGKNAVYIEDNGVVLAIEQFASAAEYMVVTNVNTGYTTMGYPQIMGYTSTAAVKDIITLNAVNNYWYAQIDAKVYTEGTLVALTKDALGYYDVKVKADNYTAAADAKINVKNGIVSAENITNFPTFAATADLVWIVRNEANKYETYIGIPASGAYIDVDADSIFYDATAKFIYVNGGKFAGNAAGGNAWGTAPVQSTIVYLDAAALATRVETNVIGNVNIFGTVSTYSNAIDMINGGYVNVSYTDYNFNRLTAGFYKVEGGRIVGAADDLVGTALLADADRLTKWTYSWIPEYNSANTYYTDDLKTVKSVLPTLYVEGSGVTDQLAKTDTAAYKALNDATTDGKNDALVVYYAKAMFADSKPIFLAKDITVDAALVKYVAPVVPAKVPMTVVFEDLNGAAVAGKVDLFKAATVSAATTEIKGWKDATTAKATVEIADVKVGDSYILALDNNYANITAKYYANDLYAVGDDYTTDAAFAQLATANKAYNYYKFVITEDMIVDGKVEYVVTAAVAEEVVTPVDPWEARIAALEAAIKSLAEAMPGTPEINIDLESIKNAIDELKNAIPEIPEIEIPEINFKPVVDAIGALIANLPKDEPVDLSALEDIKAALIAIAEKDNSIDFSEIIAAIESLKPETVEYKVKFIAENADMLLVNGQALDEALPLANGLFTVTAAEGYAFDLTDGAALFVHEPYDEAAGCKNVDHWEPLAGLYEIRDDEILVNYPIANSLLNIVKLYASLADENGVITIAIDAQISKYVSVNIVNDTENTVNYYYEGSGNSGAFVETLKVLVPEAGMLFDVTAEENTVKMTVEGAEYEEYNEDGNDGVAIDITFDDEEVTVFVEKVFIPTITVDNNSGKVFEVLDGAAFIINEYTVNDGIYTYTLDPVTADELANLSFKLTVVGDTDDFEVTCNNNPVEGENAADYSGYAIYDIELDENGAAAVVVELAD